MGVKQRIKTIVPHRVWRVLQGCKANMTLASYYAGQRKRFLRFCAGQWNVGQSEQLRGTMVYYIHRIEKDCRIDGSVRDSADPRSGSCVP